MNPIRGIALKLVSVVIFTVMAAIVKKTAVEIPPGEAVFFRSFFAIPVILAWLTWRGAFPGELRTGNLMGHFWRSLVGATSMVCGFLALGLLPFPEAVAIGYAAPLLATIFAAMFLGERVRVYRLAAVAFGLIGVTLILSPRLTVLDAGDATKLETVGAFAGFTAAVFAALATVFVRRLVQTEATAAIVFYFSVIASLLSLLTLPWGWALPGAATLALLVLVGLLGGIGQVLMTASFKYAETAVIAPFDYASMIFALLIGWFFFDELPEWVMILGATIVVASGLLIIWRERQLGIQRARTRKAMTPQG
jgi:drug/metabolite transporter (DMT)-like permease